MTKLEKLAILKAGGHGPDMVDLSEVVGNVQLEAVVLDVGIGVVAMNEDICTPAIDKLRTDVRVSNSLFSEGGEWSPPLGEDSRGGFGQVGGGMPRETSRQ